MVCLLPFFIFIFIFVLEVRMQLCSHYHPIIFILFPGILDSGRPITLKCLSHIYNPNHLYLNGLTGSEGVNLAPNTTGGNTGTHWLPIKLADGIYAFKCLGHINNRYLNGYTGTGDVNLAPGTHGLYTGTHWQANMLPDGNYSFKCLGHIYNPNNLYLDGLTGSGGVSLAPSVSGGFTGTHWRIG